MIRLLTDSMSDLTQQESAALDVTVLPLTIRFGEEEYRDGIDLKPDAFYEKLKTVTELPKTSQVSPDRFRKAFNELLRNHEDEVLYISGSSLLSGTYQSGTVGRELCEDPGRVHIVDSLSASPGVALLVHLASRRVRDFECAAKLAAWLESVRNRTRLIGQAENLKYMVMGGRLNAAAGAVGALLHVHPVLHLTDGTMHQAGLCRSLRKANEWFVSQLKSCPADPDFPMIVSGAGCPQYRADALKTLVDSGVAVPEMMETNIGPVIGTYTGPGLTSVCWVAKE